jgi:hypothetical protein
MAKDLTIRLLGRPQVTKDDQVGYQRIARQYVVEGYRASQAGINDPSNPLFLAVGTADEEFTDHYLVNQKITPKQGSVDTAYLSREFVEIRNTHVQESVVASADLKRIRRTYVVLRAQHARGYDTDTWGKHPINGGGGEPWGYAPSIVSTSPDSINYGLPEQYTIAKTPQLGGNGLYSAINAGQSDGVNSGIWLKGSAQVSSSQPGVDVWSVEWVNHTKAYWTSGTKKAGSSSFTIPKGVSFDSDGLKISLLTTTEGSSSYMQVGTFNFFVTAENIPTYFANYWLGSSSSSPAVLIDVTFTEYEGDNKSYKITQKIPNAIFEGSGGSLSFPGSTGGSVKVADIGLNALNFNQVFSRDMFGGVLDTTNYPMFQNRKMKSVGGSITWDNRFDPADSTAAQLNVVVRPIFTSSSLNESKKIWKVSISYVG